jgi:hypothetical protein
MKDKKFYSKYNMVAHDITMDELKAINKQYEELDWIEPEQKQETNLEHYYNALLKTGCNRFGVTDGKVKPCINMSCSQCDLSAMDHMEYCKVNAIKWLASPYKKPTYKLTQFEYDLLSVHKDYKTYNNIANQTHLFKMREKGYFKNIDTNIPIREILDNCEVKEDE